MSVFPLIFKKVSIQFGIVWMRKYSNEVEMACFQQRPKTRREGTNDKHKSSHML